MARICHDTGRHRNARGSLVRRELRLDDRPARQLALPDSAAGHSRARPHQPEIAAHEPIRALEIGEHLTAIVGDGLLIRTPRSPAAPAPAPAAPAPATAPAPTGAPAVPQ